MGMIIERRELQGLRIGEHVVTVGRITKGKVKLIVKNADPSAVSRLDEAGQVEVPAASMGAFLQANA